MAIATLQAPVSREFEDSLSLLWRLYPQQSGHGNLWYPLCQPSEPRVNQILILFRGIAPSPIIPGTPLDVISAKTEFPHRFLGLCANAGIRALEVSEDHLLAELSLLGEEVTELCHHGALGLEKAVTLGFAGSALATCGGAKAAG
jgi:hypothetical protein